MPFDYAGYEWKNRVALTLHARRAPPRIDRHVPIPYAIRYYAGYTNMEE